MSGYRASYTISEDRRILRYILDGDYIAQVMGNTLWKQMESENICPDRTWQSLKNRFRRHIMPYVTRPEYQLQPSERDLLKAVLKPSIASICETCHTPLRSKPAAPAVHEIDSSSTDEEAATKSNHSKLKVVTETNKRKKTKENIDAFFNLEMTDSSDTS